MVVEQGQAEQPENAQHPPPVSRKPRNREVSSRYKTAIPAPAASRRFPSPNFGRVGDVALPEPPKRALSAERKRDGCGSDDATRASVSLQNSRIDHALKPAANGLASTRTRGSTPERKRPPGSRQNMDQVENARPLENVSKPELQKWPGTANGKSISRSLDLNLEREKTRGSSITKVSRGLASVRSLSQVDEANKNSRNSNKVDEIRSVRSSYQVVELRSSESLNQVDGLKAPRSTVKQIHETSRSIDEVSTVVNRGDGLNADGAKHARSLSQDTEIKTHSTINETTSRVRRRLVDDEACVPDSTTCEGAERDHISAKSEGTLDNPVLSSSRVSKPVRGTIVPARFWQDLGNRIRRLSDVNQLRASLPDGDLLTAGSKTARRSKGSSLPTSAASSPANAAPWTYSPGRVPSSTQPSSPSRGMRSPTRTRSAAFPVPPNGLNFQVSSRSNSVACMLNFGAEVSRGKKAMSQQEEAQYLRILHNRWLQWRYVNARTEFALSSQQAAVERMLYSTWLQISDLQTRVAEKRIKLQTTRQDAQVHSFIASHRDCLEDWARIEPEQKLAVAGAIQALEAATLKVPVTGGAKIDIQALKNAMAVAADAIAPLDSATSDLLPQAETTNEILSQLAQVSSQGKALLEECGDLLDRIATLETEEWSLRAYFVQLEIEKKRQDS